LKSPVSRPTGPGETVEQWYFEVRLGRAISISSRKEILAESKSVTAKSNLPSPVKSAVVMVNGYSSALYDDRRVKRSVAVAEKNTDSSRAPASCTVTACAIYRQPSARRTRLAFGGNLRDYGKKQIRLKKEENATPIGTFLARS
jgi:hypothetical protein